MAPPDVSTGPFLAHRPLTGNAAHLDPRLIKNFFAWPSTRETALLTWELDTPDWINIRIERSADGSPPETIARLSRSEQFTDSTVPRASLTRQIVYRIFVEGEEDPVATTELGATKINPIADIVTTGERALLRMRGMATVWWAFKSTGSRCVCWDPIRKRILDENCQKCSGTGRRDGYGQPALIHMLAENAEQRNVDIPQGGEIEQNSRTLWTDADVLLRPRDVLVLPGAKRYRVDSVVQNSNLGTPTRQIARCLEVNPSDIEFDLEIPLDILFQLQRQPDRAIF